MSANFQSELFDKVKARVKSNESFVLVLSEVLSLSNDAVYRRLRGDTALTINEVAKLCNHFAISFDELCCKQENVVLFEYNPLKYYDFSLEGYLEGMLRAIESLSKLTNPKIILTSNNIPVLQLLNFPRLSRFRLYFWAKSHLNFDEYKRQKLSSERVTEKAFSLGAEILEHYVNIPSVECYDTEFLKGLVRQIQYYSSAKLFEEPEYALKLLNDVQNMSNHIFNQTETGLKIKFKDDPANTGTSYEVFINETINADSTFYYSSVESEGIFLTHNVLNYLHTTDKAYVSESLLILNQQLKNASPISRVNEKYRNSYFHALNKTIENAIKQISHQLEESQL